MDLARLDSAISRRPDLISDDVQTPQISGRLFGGVQSFEYRGLGADGELVPSLKSIDRIVWHETNKRGLEVECFRRAPV